MPGPFPTTTPVVPLKVVVGKLQDSKSYACCACGTSDCTSSNGLFCTSSTNTCRQQAVVAPANGAALMKAAVVTCLGSCQGGGCKKIKSLELSIFDQLVFGVFFCLLLMTRDVHAGSCATNEIPSTSCELEENPPAMCTLKSPSSCHGTYQYMVQKTGAENPFHGVSFNPQSSSQKPGEGTAPRAVDINNDGKMDLFVGMGNGKIEYWKHTGSPSVPSFTQQTGDNNPFKDVDIPNRPKNQPLTHLYIS